MSVLTVTFLPARCRTPVTCKPGSAGRGFAKRPAVVVPRASRQRASSTVSAVDSRKLLDSVSKLAGAVVLAVVLSAGTPDTAEAARSGGRAGGSAGFSRCRAAPAPRPAPGPRVQNNYYSSPSPFGFSPFGFSPFGFSPFGFGGGAVAVGAPVGGGFIFQMFLVTALISVVGSVVRGFSQRKRDDEEDW